MNLHDPSRPRLANGLPMYPVDRPVAAVPSLAITATPDGYKLDVMLAVEPNSYRWFKQVSTAALAEVIDDWHHDPEEAMRKHFNWHFTFTTPKKRESTTTLTLEDLGL